MSTAQNMNGNFDLSDSKPLIDFSSPVAKRRVQTPPNIPLIPVPAATNKISVSPTNSNPFDVVARLTAQNDDPFECVYKTAFNNINDNKQNALNPEENQNVSRKDTVESQDQSEEPDLNVSPIVKCVGNKIEEYSKSVDKPNDNDISAISLAAEDSISINSVNTFTPQKAPSEPSLQVQGSESKYQSGDFSTEEDLKAVIAKRVNKCIQKVLNNSVKTKLSKSDENIKSIDGDKKHTHHRRSLSFITMSDVGIVTSDRLNKSCIDSQIATFIVNEEKPNSEHDFNQSYDIKPMTTEENQISTTDDSVFFLSESDQVFEEANKLACVFSKIAESFTQNTEYTSDNEEDLLSCKPKWLYADSSEDEDEKLRNDPALNIRVSFTSSAVQKPSDSPALAAFKSRQRHSLSHLQSTQEVSNIKRCNSIGCKPVTVPVMPIIAPSVSVVMKPDEVLVKLKKKPATDSKRGPLKAVMPVQNMTKEFIPCEVTGKLMTIRDPSPIRKQNSIQIVGTPNKDNSQLGMQPVACSTPNKIISARSNLLVPTIEIPGNKRRSLGSTIESRKGRTTLPEEGSRKRSNSANSSIPTPLVVVKPLKAHPLVKSPLKPKSTSSLVRSSPSNTQGNVQRSTKPEKKSSKPLKANSRALSEVNSPSPRPGRVKSTITAISSLVKGKGKKVSSCDKENRIPV